MRQRLLLPVVLSLLAAPAFADPTTYTIDAENSEVVVFVYKAGVAARLAHDHVIEAKEFEGTITWDSQKPEATQVALTVQAKSLVADDPELRKKHKLPEGLSASDCKEIEETLKGDEQLDVEKHPKISFKSVKLRIVKDSHYLEGVFTLRGVEKKVSFLVLIAEQKDGEPTGQREVPGQADRFRIRALLGLPWRCEGQGRRPDQGRPGRQEGEGDEDRLTARLAWLAARAMSS